MPYDPSSADLLYRGATAFNSENYFEAHEIWEDLWNQTEGSQRGFYQGLIHAAVGLYHLSRENRTGGRNQLGKALLKLGGYPDDCDGINNGALQAALKQVLEDGDRRFVRILRTPPDAQPL